MVACNFYRDLYRYVRLGGKAAICTHGNDSALLVFLSLLLIMISV